MISSGKDVLLARLDVMREPRSPPEQLARVLEQQQRMGEQWKSSEPTQQEDQALPRSLRGRAY
jgi:hypothetical protein